MIKTYKNIVDTTHSDFQEKALNMVNAVILVNGGQVPFTRVSKNLIGYENDPQNAANTDFTRGWFAVGYIIDTQMSDIAFSQVGHDGCVVSIYLKTNANWEIFCKRFAEI